MKGKKLKTKPMDVEYEINGKPVSESHFFKLIAKEIKEKNKKKKK